MSVDPRSINDVFRDVYGVATCGARHSFLKQCDDCDRVVAERVERYAAEEAAPKSAEISFPADDLGNPVDE